MITISDGILDETRWRQAKRKVLFVLKEPGADCGYKSLQELFQKEWGGQAKYSFLNLARWAYGIQNTDESAYPTFAEASDKLVRDDAFFKSAIINLKKTPSTRADRSCDEEGVREYVISNQESIKDQIKLIRPDVIVCCSHLTYLLVDKMLSGGRGEVVILEAPHPSARAWKNKKGVIRRTAKDKYEDVMNDYRQSLDWEDHTQHRSPVC